MRPTVSSVTAFVTVLASLLASTARTYAQTVKTVSGSTITISAGTLAGVRVGMTGTLCTKVTVGGKSASFCPGSFEVVSVTESDCRATITKKTDSIETGFTAKFSQKLVGETATAARTPKNSSPRPKSIEVLKAEGDRAFDNQDYATAKSRFEEIIRRFPVSQEAEYAAPLLQRCEQNIKAARSVEAERLASERAEVEVKRQALEAERLVADARRLVEAEAWREALKKTEEALTKDPLNAEAQSIRMECQLHLLSTLSEVALAELSKRLLEAGDWRRAGEAARTALFKDSGNSIARGTLTSAYVREATSVAYTVQLALVCDGKVLAKLEREIGVEVWYVPAPYASDRCLRVFYGRFSSKKEAERAKESMNVGLLEATPTVVSPKGPAFD